MSGATLFNSRPSRRGLLIYFDSIPTAPFGRNGLYSITLRALGIAEIVLNLTSLCSRMGLPDVAVSTASFVDTMP